jgi:hypothetical protein
VKRGAGQERELLDCIPSNWCDSLLTGDKAALQGKPGTWGCPDIERLLNAIRIKLALAIGAQEVKARASKRKAGKRGAGRGV